MTCNYCGNQIPDDSVFCPNCGAGVQSSNNTYQQPQTQAPQADYSQPQYTTRLSSSL